MKVTIKIDKKLKKPQMSAAAMMKPMIDCPENQAILKERIEKFDQGRLKMTNQKLLDA